jgi:probable HAF family extracellular repeat protein
VIAGLLLVTGCGIAPRYHLVDLGVLPGDTSSQATDINNLGQVVGFSIGPSGERAFVWDASRGIQEVGDLPGGSVSSHANAINDAGLIVGKSVTWSNATHAFLFTPGPGQGMRDLGDFPGGADFSEANDINASVQVVGTGYGGVRQWTAFLWDQDNGLQDLAAIAGLYGISEATAINDSGEIVGNYTKSGGFAGFIYDRPRGLREIAPLNPGMPFPADISSNGRIAGAGLLSNDRVAFSGDRYVVGPLPDLPGRPSWISTDQSGATGVNDAKDMVGWSMDAGGSKAVVWGYMYGLRNLNDMILDSDPLRASVLLTRAVAINNYGDIAANGVINGVVHGFLLKRFRYPNEQTFK